MNTKTPTFIISDGRDGGFTQAIYEAREFTKNANVSVLHSFSDFYHFVFEPAKNDFSFRLLIHLGMGDSGVSTKIGEKILEDFKGKPEFKKVADSINFITRNPNKFGENYYIEEPESNEKKKKFWNANRINRDEAYENFLETNRPYQKDLLINDHVTIAEKTKNSKTNKPKIFIGSSSNGEALETAMAIKRNLNDIATCHIWNENVFKIGETTLDTLERIIHEYDYSIFVFRGDDTLFERNGKTVPRDNVILEYGMFLGTQTRKRTFFVIPKDTDIHIATDLLGLTYPIPYDLYELKENSVAALSIPCSQIREVIQRK
jgi:predicted nucleotide-binding protein